MGKRDLIDDLKQQVAELERRLAAFDADHEERIAAIEAACRAFAVVFAIPRVAPDDPPTGEGDRAG